MTLSEEAITPLSSNILGATNVSRERPTSILLPDQTDSPIRPSDQEGSSPDDSNDVADLEADDAKSVVGVSISKEQTRLKSPQTPSAEKAAALAGLDGGGLFDGANEEQEQEELENFSEKIEENTPRKQIPSQHGETDSSLPSPWQAKAKPFERTRTNGTSYQLPMPTGLLPDFGVRRYLNNISLPSLPKAPSLRDFSVPSIGTILGSTRSRSPSTKGSNRSKRANTMSGPSSSSFVQKDVSISPNQASKSRDHVDFEAANLTRSSNSQHSQPSAGATDNKSRPQVIRRVTSDQSLLLRRVTSNVSSLGDDTRWEHVQEQVNSRMKAIKDSLQDSSIKLPSMPNLSLTALRPDFTRTRASSDARLITRDRSGSDGIQKINPRTMDARQTVSNATTRPGESGSKPSPSHMDEALERLTGDVVILGGYRGSILRSAKPPHRQLWVPVKVGLNIRKVNLEVGLEPEDEENMKEEIFASGMLSHIGPVDMGRRLLKRLRTCRNAQEGRLRIHEYGYDWRLSPHLLSDRFFEFLKGLKCNKPGVPVESRGATVIAHSMGGLITRHVVNRAAELFAGVVYAGVPLHCVNILGPMRNGDDVLLSSKVLTAQVNFTLRSSYVLLPESGHCFINKETKEEYPVNFFDVEDWKKYAWSPCIAPALPAANTSDSKGLLESVTDMLPTLPSLPSLPSLPFSGRKASIQTNDVRSETADTSNSESIKPNELISDASASRALDPQMSATPPISDSSGNPNFNSKSTIPLPDALNYLTRTLAATLRFKSELAFNPAHSDTNTYPPLSIIYATNTPTVSAARVSSRDAIARADAYDDLQFGSGDGVCLARAAMLPKGYEVTKGGKVRTERGHVGLLGDLEAVGRCLTAVRRGRRRGVGLGRSEDGGRKGGGKET